MARLLRTTSMRRDVRVIAGLLACITPVLAAGSARAGGVPTRLVVVGAGRSVTIGLPGGEGDALYAGRTASPRGGYLRLFPLFANTPGLPGRFYPAGAVVCFDPPSASCHRAVSAVAARLDAIEGLPLLHRAPTVVVGLRSHGRSAGSNLGIATELALDRPGRPARPPHGRVAIVTATWRGPAAARRPRRIELSSAGVYAAGRLHRLPKAVWNSWGKLLLAPARPAAPPARRPRPGSAHGHGWTAPALVAALVAAVLSAGAIARRRTWGRGRRAAARPPSRDGQPASGRVGSTGEK
jgi:hypothetical protein